MHATGSKAFTENMRRIVGQPRRRRSSRYFNQFGNADANDIDVLILDEAHRIRETISQPLHAEGAPDRSAPDRRTPQGRQDDSVFFIDDLQVVRPNESRQHPAHPRGRRQAAPMIHEFELETQFRSPARRPSSAGSTTRSGWPETANPLGGRRRLRLPHRRLGRAARRADPLARQGRAHRPPRRRLLLAMVQTRTTTARSCPTSRWGTGRCPGTPKPDAGRLAPGIPQVRLLGVATRRGINQVGCVYTAQGFEFDYVGVIFGRDLRWDPATESWIGDLRVPRLNRQALRRPRFTDLVKRTYRVLLTRGMRGCYVFFEDPETSAIVSSRIRIPGQLQPLLSRS